MPKGYSKEAHPEMYVITETKDSNHFKESVPFLIGAWSKFMDGKITKSELQKIINSLILIWR